MKNVLVTTIGKPGGKDGGHYRKADYSFGDGKKYSSSFFGLSLYQFLKDSGRAIEKIVVLGTATSMWDALYEFDDDFFMEHGDEADSLNGKINGGVKEEYLDSLKAALSNHFGIEVSTVIIPMGRNAKEQIRIVRLIEENVDNGDNLIIDVTHGLRFLPMLEFMSAFLLSLKKETTVESVYYGAFELRDGSIAPAVRLDGICKLNEWIKAIAVLKDTGNPVPLSRFEEMKEVKDDLSRYQYFRQINNLDMARARGAMVLRHIEALKERSPLAAIFIKELRRNFEWCDRPGFIHNQQEAESKLAYKNGEYLRSVILLFEAFISCEMHRSGEADIYNHDKREKYKSILWKRSKIFTKLAEIRNSFVHGISRSLRTWEDFDKTMEKAFQEFNNLKSVRPLLIRKTARQAKSLL